MKSLKLRIHCTSLWTYSKKANSTIRWRWSIATLRTRSEIFSADFSRVSLTCTRVVLCIVIWSRKTSSSKTRTQEALSSLISDLQRDATSRNISSCDVELLDLSLLKSLTLKTSTQLTIRFVTSSQSGLCSIFCKQIFLFKNKNQFSIIIINLFIFGWFRLIGKSPFDGKTYNDILS